MKKAAAVICAAIIAASPTALANSDINIFVNGNYIDCDSYVIDDTTYIPLRAVSEALGAEVAYNETTNTAEITLDEDDTIPTMIDEVSESVVAIVGNADSSSSYFQSEGYGIGTGVVIKSNGQILTNSHVVNGISNITVIFRDGTSYPGAVLYDDSVSDLAVIKIEKLGLKPIQFGDESDLVVGKTVFAIGTPLSLSYRNTATRGMISGTSVSVNDYYYQYLQTDAAINNGNSGGPLVNKAGELLGINSMGYTSADGMGFAIPIDTIQYVLNQFETNGTVMRASINAVFETSWEAKIGLPTTNGLTVKSSSYDNLLAGDVVTAVNGIAIHSKTELNEALKDTYTSGTVTLTLTRSGETMEIEVTPTLG